MPSASTQQALRQTKNEQFSATAPNRQTSATNQYQKGDKDTKVNGIGSRPGLGPAPRNDDQCFVPKIFRASAGEAMSRPAFRAQAASASTSWPFEVTLVPSPR
jgi:hypothetical protein